MCERQRLRRDYCNQQIQYMNRRPAACQQVEFWDADWMQCSQKDFELGTNPVPLRMNSLREMSALLNELDEVKLFEK